MSLEKKIGLLAGAASASLAGLTFGEYTPSDVDARVAALEAEIDAIKGETGNGWLTPQREEEIRALVHDVLSDSATRASLLQDNVLAGYDPDAGFYLRSGDESFSMNVNAFAQFRYVYNNNDSEESDQDRAGFEMRRTKLIFDGHLFGKDLEYKLQGNFDRDGGAFELEDAYFTYQLGNGWGVTWGQFKLPFQWEELVSSSRQLAVERSYFNEVFTKGRSQGIMLGYESDAFRWDAAFSDGYVFSEGVNGELANTGWQMRDTEYAITSRIDFLVSGDSWSQFKDFTSWNDDPFAAKIGAAVHWQDGEYGDTFDEEAEVLQWTIDGAIEGGGWNLFAAFNGADVDLNPDGANDPEQWGFMVQGGVFLVPDKFELFGRWEWLDLDASEDLLDDDFDTNDIEDELNLLTAGFNYYFEEHNWKWTTDVVWAPDGVPDATSALGLVDSNDEEMFVLRTQMQISTK